MADPYYKKTPYGWCFDHGIESRAYCKMSWQEYVDMIGAFLNEQKVNYSVLHYGNWGRIHIYFSSIRKMGFKKAVELSWINHQEMDWDAMLGKGRGWTYEDVKQHVADYFIKNDLTIKEE